MLLFGQSYSSNSRRIAKFYCKIDLKSLPITGLLGSDCWTLFHVNQGQKSLANSTLFSDWIRTMKASRRTMLGVLGLAPAAAVAAEDFAAPTRASQAGFLFGLDRDRVVDGLTRLVEDIRRGDTLVMSLNVKTDLTPSNFITHVLSLEYAMRAEVEAER